MDLLTPLQQKLLNAIGQSALGDTFYLTGGTALSAFYLEHRYSEDLDFFTADPLAVNRVAPILQEIATQLAVQVAFTRVLGSFLECFVWDAQERVKLDFAQDTPYRLQPLRRHELHHVYLDSLPDIAANKLSALFDRAEPKDFVDVYFLCQETMPFAELLSLARQKHVGIDDYWLAIALQRVRSVSLLPRMVRPISLADMQAFFLQQAERLIRSADSGPG